MQNIHGNRFMWKDRHLSNCAFIQPISVQEKLTTSWSWTSGFWLNIFKQELEQSHQKTVSHRKHNSTTATEKWAEINNTHRRPTKLPASTEHTGFMGRASLYRSGTAQQLSRGMKVLKNKQKWINTDTHWRPTKLPPSTEHMGFMGRD